MTFFLRTILVIAVLIFVAGCVTQKSAVGIKEVLPSDDWVETTLEHLTLEQKVAQMVVPKVFCSYISTESDEWKRLAYLVKDVKVGGIIVYAGDVYETAMIINQLQALADVPLLVSADFERGLAMRIRRATAFPDAMALAATRDTSLVYRMGRTVAEESRALGVHQDYAPVADVNVNPDNPIINTRSFGEDPNWVAGMASAFSRGLQDGGVIATAKHFPGHGDVSVDSHLGLPVLAATPQRLDTMELVPFRALIGTGIQSVMVGHIGVPSIDSSGLPATLSPKLVSSLLEQRMGFHGLVVCDAIEMFGVLNSFRLDEASVRAVEAGIDVLLAPPPGSEMTVVDAVKNAVLTGRLSEERINMSVKKILAIKKSLGLDENRMTDISAIPAMIGTPDHWQVARDVARASVTVLKNDNVIPLQRIDSIGRIALAVVSDNDDYRTEVNRPGAPLVTNERVGSYFAAQLRRRFKNVETFRIDPRSNASEVDSILTSVKAADVIVCPVYVKARSGSGKFGLPPHIIDWTNTLALQGKPTVFIAMGSPYTLGALKNGSAYLCTYSDGELSTDAAVEALFGEIPIRGRLPVTIPGLYARGSGINVPAATLREDSPVTVGFDSMKLVRLDSLIQRAIGDSAFPGAQLLVARDGSVVYNKAFGRLEYSPASRAVDKATMYDLASLTKVVATTSAILRLYEENCLRLEDSVVWYLPEFGNHGKEGITVRNLLMHNSGLPAFKKLYSTAATPQAVLDSVYNSELIYSPGDSTLYSDFGFIVLGKIVETITGKPLDRYVSETFFQPLGMTRTMFTPPKSLWSNIAPTELDTVWRKALVWGTVHDETAALLGGVAGHAGLFSTASDLAVFAQMMLDKGFYGGRNYLKPESFVLATTKQDTNSTRALGWDTRTPTGYSSAGALFGLQSFGHTGFTGTSIWVDPGRNLFVIFLTNRAYPTRDNTKIYKIRPELHDVVISALKDINHNSQ